MCVCVKKYVCVYVCKRISLLLTSGTTTTTKKDRFFSCLGFGDKASSVDVFFQHLHLQTRRILPGPVLQWVTPESHTYPWLGSMRESKGAPRPHGCYGLDEYPPRAHVLKA